jgi:hypothetical protein
MSTEEQQSTGLRQGQPASSPSDGSAFSFMAQFGYCWKTRKAKARGNGFFDCWKEDCLCSAKNCRRIHAPNTEVSGAGPLAHPETEADTPRPLH